MKKVFEKQVSIPNGVVISDPIYDKNVQCRYENRQNMRDYRLCIYVNEDKEMGYLDVACTLLDEVAHERVKLANGGNSFTRPVTFKVKSSEIGVDTATVLVGANHVYKEEICTGSDGYFGSVYQINRPVLVNGKTKNIYSGILLFAGFDSSLWSVQDVVDVLAYNFTGEQR